jgi:transcriptional regulator with XRE-family HTH domain
MEAQMVSRNLLKQYRVREGLTQKALAAKLHVTQPTYQRWETGHSEMPADKLQKLAMIFKTTTERLLNNHAQIVSRAYQDDPETSYYGEIAIHFKGGGEPLLLSITEAAFDHLNAQLNKPAAFVGVESLANQTVAIRTDAISDLYFSSEAYDDLGPEDPSENYGPNRGPGYENHIEVRLADPRDWEIIEAFADDADLDDFDQDRVRRVCEIVGFDYEQPTPHLTLVAPALEDEQTETVSVDASIAPPSEAEIEQKQKEQDELLAQSQRDQQRVLDAASKITYQLSTGQRRTMRFFNEDLGQLLNLVECLHPRAEIGDHGLIRITEEGNSHRVVFINPVALDYISLPTHRYDAAVLGLDAKALDTKE